jgi:hypothetical protein
MDNFSLGEFTFDEAHDISLACQGILQAPDDFSDAIVASAGTLYADSGEEEEVAPPPPRKSESEIPWAVAVAVVGEAPAVSVVPIVPVVLVVPVVPVVPVVQAAKARKLKRKRNWGGFLGASVNWDNTHKKFLARLTIKKKCKQRCVGYFAMEESARPAFAAALADVEAFLREKKRGRKRRDM